MKERSNGDLSMHSVWLYMGAAAHLTIYTLVFDVNSKAVAAKAIGKDEELNHDAICQLSECRQMLLAIQSYLETDSKMARPVTASILASDVITKKAVANLAKKLGEIIEGKKSVIIPEKELIDMLVLLDIIHIAYTKMASSQS